MSQVILVFGVSRGIGLEIVSSLLSHSNALVHGISRTSPVKPIENERFTWEKGDLSDTLQGPEIVKRVISKYGRIDAIIYNSGTLDPMVKLESLNLSDLDVCFKVNLTSFLGIVKEALPCLRLTNGKVLAVSSGAAVKSRPGWGSYCMTKAALNLAIQTFALEEPNILFLAIRPGVVDTEMQKQIRETGLNVMGEEAVEPFIQLHQQGKLLDPKLPANAISYCAVNALKNSKDVNGLFIDWNDSRLGSFQ